MKKEVERRDRRASQNPAYRPTLGLLAMLGSIAVHAEELLDDEAILGAGHEFDKTALRQLVKAHEVQAWLQQMGPLVPKKRRRD